MNSLPDHQPSSVMGYPYQNGPGKEAAPPPPYQVPYQGGVGYASPYQTYTNPLPTANPKEYPSQSFNMWYKSDQYSQWGAEPTISQKFTRLMIATMVTLLISMCMISFVIWLLFRTDVPNFEVASFSVSNLSISGAIIESSWFVNMTVTNPDSDLKINAGEIKASILYKDFPLVMTSIEPSYTQGQTQGFNQVNVFFTLDHQKSICKEDMALEITEAEKSGILIVSLRLALISRFSSHPYVWRHDSLKIFCEDLKLLMITEGVGELDADSQMGCLMIS